MTDVFISYASADRERAREVAEALEGLGLSVWWDREIPAGRTFDEVIEEALEQASCVVVLWSSAAVGSDWVRSEAREGKTKKVLIPAFIEPVDLPLEFRSIQAADLTDWQPGQRTKGFRNLTRSLESMLGRSLEPSPSRPILRRQANAPTPSPGFAEFWDRIRPWLQRRPVQILLLAIVVSIFAAVFLVDGDDASTLVDPEGELDALVASIRPVTDLETTIQICPDCTSDLARTLPDIDEFPIVVAPVVGGSDLVVEIWASSEKAGEGTDGWIRGVAEAFNDAGVTVDGRPAKVRIRRIASGTAYQYIFSGKDAPDGYTPSNHLWIAMAAEEVPMTPVSEQLVPNVAGLVLEAGTARQLRADYGSLNTGTLLEAVNNGDVVMGYTDPFVSSTGLNFLITALDSLAGGDLERMLAPDVIEAFQGFQSTVPFVASTTLQLRDCLLKDDCPVDAFVMEYQTFVNTETLSSGFEFVPFGIAHDNPLYAVGDIDGERLQVLQEFADFAAAEEHRRTAMEFGFEPPDYEPELALPGGRALVESQRVWKENKDGGVPVTAVFVTDISGSMSGPRMEALKPALLQSLEFISPANSVGLVVFDDTVTVVLEVEPFDGDQKGRFTAAINRMQPFGGTAMYDAIAVALDMLVDERAANPGIRPMVIVLTDGRTTFGHEFADVEPIISALRIPVYSVGFEADLDELNRLSSLVEAASFNASEGTVASTMARLFNSQL